MKQIVFCNFSLGKVYRFKSNNDLNEIGYVNSKGFKIFKYDGKTTSVHRYLYEQYHKIKLSKDDFISHKDGNPLNNCIDNLELKVYKDKRPKFLEIPADKNISIQNNKYRLRINRKHIGYFNTIAEAKIAKDNYLFLFKL